jgi:hypothetical protein
MKSLKVSLALKPKWSEYTNTGNLFPAIELELLIIYIIYLYSACTRPIGRSPFLFPFFFISN